MDGSVFVSDVLQRLERRHRAARASDELGIKNKEGRRGWAVEKSKELARRRERLSLGAIRETGTSIADALELSPVYQTERWSYNQIQYAFTVKPGRYQLILHFAETNRKFSQAGKRTFDVLVNGAKVHTAVDIFAAAGAESVLR